MKKISVGTTKSYDILIKNGLLKECGQLTSAVKKLCKVMICCDETVKKLYGGTVFESYGAAGFNCEFFTFAPGEKSKTTGTVTELLENMGAAEFDRGDLLVALGGGVAGDIGGFAAALYMRGIDYVQIPTTLLAAVDSAVGGKTGVNLACGKNMAGSFWQPILVVCDTDVFKTLSSEVYSGGVAEVIKYGFIFGSCPWELAVDDMVAACCKYKADIVAKDERDKEGRLLLNFGHTIGHAIEKASDYTILHGQAVAIGMAAVARAAEKRQIVGIGTASHVEEVCKKFGLPTKTDVEISKIKSAARADKKRDESGITVIILDRAVHFTMDELDSFIEEGLA